jgi:hypothetical protein
MGNTHGCLKKKREHGEHFRVSDFAPSLTMDKKSFFVRSAFFLKKPVQFPSGASDNGRFFPVLPFIRGLLHLQ